MRKILITGGAGFIGSHLSKKLVSKGYEVTVLDNLSPQVHGDPNSSPLYLSIKDKVRFIRGDVRCRDDWEKALKGQDAVIHLAAETGVGQSMYEIDKYVDVNIGGTSKLLQLLINSNCDVQKLIVASSRAVYGEGKYLCDTCGVVSPPPRKHDQLAKGIWELQCPNCGQEIHPLPTDEGFTPNPASVYAVSKQSQEQLSLVVGEAKGIPVTILRYQNVYGPRQALNNPYTGVLSAFATQIKNGNPVPVYEDGSESRDFVYVSDVVEATVLAMENSQSNGEIINVGSGERTTIREGAEALVNNLDPSIPIKVTGEYRVGDIRHSFASLAKAKRLLGYSPKIPFASGIREFARWVESQSIARDRSDEAKSELLQWNLLGKAER